MCQTFENMGTTEAQSGDRLRWPAEWEHQDAVWISWPHRKELWRGGLARLEKRFAELVRVLSPFVQVRINAAAGLHPHLKEVLEGTNYALYDHPTDDVWCRDHGGIFTLAQQQEQGKPSLQVADWTFNAWGGQFPPWDKDNDIPKRMAESLCLPCLSSDFVLEGGAIEGNGDGLLITTEAVLLDPNRNPEATQSTMEAELHRMLGTQSVFWLGSGITGDDTGGHIDDMVRFVRRDVVVAATETDAHSPHYHALAENNERLQDLRTCGGRRVEVVPLPMPEPVSCPGWRLEQLPASYANFLICNSCVLVPTFAQAKADDHALGILRECFSSHHVIGFDARDLLIEGGAIHCITQQQPSVKN